ncbi:MAG: hypothetical protein KF690_07065, partial [Bacteroidetes bacterium]|nr:hypothetical protein [Bacteroidota bacterium]
MKAPLILVLAMMFLGFSCRKDEDKPPCREIGVPTDTYLMQWTYPRPNGQRYVYRAVHNGQLDTFDVNLRVKYRNCQGGCYNYCYDVLQDVWEFDELSYTHELVGTTYSSLSILAESGQRFFVEFSHYKDDP